jgi:valyl-tRNA synthetase
LISFIRDEFADFAIEAYKIEKDRSVVGKEVISLIALDILALLHPYAPHITETLYGYVTNGKILASSAWPVAPFSRSIEAEMKIESIF